MGRMQRGTIMFWGSAAPRISHLSLDLNKSGLGPVLTVTI